MTTELVSIKEAMGRLGVGYTMIYNAIRRGEIEAYNLNRIMVNPHSLEQWIQSRRIVPKKKRGRPRKTTTVETKTEAK